MPTWKRVSWKILYPSLEAASLKHDGLGSEVDGCTAEDGGEEEGEGEGQAAWVPFVKVHRPPTCQLQGCGPLSQACTSPLPTCSPLASTPHRLGSFHPGQLVTFQGHEELTKELA